METVLVSGGRYREVLLRFGEAAAFGFGPVLVEEDDGWTYVLLRTDAGWEPAAPRVRVPYDVVTGAEPEDADFPGG